MENKMDRNEALLRDAKESLKLNAQRICGKLKVYQQKREMRLNNSSPLQGKEIETRTDKLSAKEEQSTKTLQWLEENFTRCPGVCLPRCIMYAHYLGFCQENNFSPACAATFGKIIRQKFPELTTRRLGTRGNSKYHYYGVAIKDSSAYCHTVYSGRGLTRFSGRKLLNEGDASRKIFSSAKSGTLLPEFPSPMQLSLPAHVELCKMETFMIMYRTHCQCILDTAVSKNYEGIHKYLVHFWQGIPKHLKSLFEIDEIISLVCICDSITFMVLNEILVPINLEEITDESLENVRNFIASFEGWLQEGLADCNKNLIEKKIHVSRRFIQTIQRQISFLHLAKSFREVLDQKTIATCVMSELDAIDIKSISAQVYTTVDCTKDQISLQEEHFCELRELLRKESSVEVYVKWLENIFTTQILQPHENDQASFKKRAHEFLLLWSFSNSRIMHVLTMNNPRTYRPFHLVGMMLEEYIQLIIESRLSKQEQMELQKLSEQLIKGTSDENCLKVSKVITKSKFGAPKHRRSTNTNSDRRIHNSGRKTQSLPSISTLQILSSNSNLLPNDLFNRRYGQSNNVTCGSVLTLTPPSSPPSKSGDAERVETVTENVENLVDEHFRNCGFENLVKQANNNETNEFSTFIQKFIRSQNQTMDPYEVCEDVFLNNSQSDDEEEDASPLQSSFSQILKGNDFFLAEQFNSDSMSSSSEQSAKNKDTLLFSSFINNTLMDNLYEHNPSTLLTVDEREETFSTIDTKSLQMSF